MSAAPNYGAVLVVNFLRAAKGVESAYTRPAAGNQRRRAKLRRDWPELAGALDLMDSIARNDPEPTK